MTNKKRKFSFEGKKIYFWWGVLGILGGLSVFLTIQMSTTGFEVAQLEKEASNLTRENSDLSNKVNSGLSLNSIEKKASELKFEKPLDIVYLGKESAVAKLP